MAALSFAPNKKSNSSKIDLFEMISCPDKTKILVCMPKGFPGCCYGKCQILLEKALNLVVSLHRDCRKGGGVSIVTAC